MEARSARDNVIARSSKPVLNTKGICFEHKAGDQVQIALIKIANEWMGTNPLLYASLWQAA